MLAITGAIEGDIERLKSLLPIEYETQPLALWVVFVEVRAPLPEVPLKPTVLDICVCLS